MKKEIKHNENEFLNFAPDYTGGGVQNYFDGYYGRTTFYTDKIINYNEIEWLKQNVFVSSVIDGKLVYLNAQPLLITVDENRIFEIQILPDDKVITPPYVNTTTANIQRIGLPRGMMQLKEKIEFGKIKYYVADYIDEGQGNTLTIIEWYKIFGVDFPASVVDLSPVDNHIHIDDYNRNTFKFKRASKNTIKVASDGEENYVAYNGQITILNNISEICLKFTDNRYINDGVIYFIERDEIETINALKTALGIGVGDTDGRKEQK